MNYLEIYFNNVLQTSYKLERDSCVIGRSDNADIKLDNKGVSSFHALISLDENKLYVEDLNSTNGTYLNTQKLTDKISIKTGDSIQISKFVLKITEWTAKQPEQTPQVSTDYNADDRTVIASIHKTSASSDNDNCYLLVKGDIKNVQKILLSDSVIRIGRAAKNEIQTNGWRFITPAYAAEIKRIGRSYYILPIKMSYVHVNGRKINNSTVLSHNDKIQVKKTSIRFLEENDETV